MLFRQTVFALALAGAAVPAAFANSGSAAVRGEQGFETHAMPGTKSRADVQRELADFRKKPKDAGGGTLAQGEASYVFPQHSYDYVKGKLTHTDTLAHNTPKPSLTMTPAEPHQYRAESVN